VRFAAPKRAPKEVRVAAAQTGTCLCDSPVVPEGRVELLWYVHEQSVSTDYHRYGNLGPRTDEQRAGPM
jgi:RHH-type proline utilization regulon transcriptional repressor/proline dehydrogenase/delta 1-pyrroline-5-carboxylate dehydrogenase